MTADECRIQDAHCITCGDEGIVMRIVEIRDGDAVCADELRARHHIAIDLVGDVGVGDDLLVHAGVAIKNLSASAHTPVGARG
jgi:hydrogenase maturation factor